MQVEAQPTETNAVSERALRTAEGSFGSTFTYACDRCGSVMIEHGCKITCINCGHRYDCSDLNLYFD